MADAGAPHSNVPPMTGPRLFSAEQARAFLGLIRAGAALETALDEGLASAHGIGLHQFEVLLFLATSSVDRSMPMIELRRRTPLSQSQVSRVVSGLEADGLVSRETDPGDSRAVIVTLTPRGAALFERARQQHQHDLEEHLFSILSGAEIRQLAAITTKLLAAGEDRSAAG